MPLLLWRHPRARTLGCAAQPIDPVIRDHQEDPVVRDRREQPVFRDYMEKPVVREH
jgi:hypothetical protein